MATFNIHVCLFRTIITPGLSASRCALADKHCRVFSFSIQEAFSFFPPSFLSAQNFSPHRGFTSQNCICSLSLIQHESRTITIQYNLCVRAYECMCAHASFSKGGGGFKPLHLHIFIMAKSQACATAAWPFAGEQAV